MDLLKFLKFDGIIHTMAKKKNKITSSKKAAAEQSTNKAEAKKVIKTVKKKQESLPKTATRSSNTQTAEPLLFGRENYLWMFAGFAVIMIGMLLMMGGSMPDSNTWDESLIYSTRRTLIAPFVILVGLTIEFFAIFRK